MGDNRRLFSDNEKMVLYNEVNGRCSICGKPLTNNMRLEQCHLARCSRKCSICN